MGLKRILSRRKSRNSDSCYSQVSSHEARLRSHDHFNNLGLNVKDSIVASYAMMSTTIADHFSDEENEDVENRGMYHKNATFESTVIHPVQCKRDIYVERVTRDKRKKGKNMFQSSIYRQNINIRRSEQPKDTRILTSVQSRDRVRRNDKIVQIPCEDEMEFAVSENVNQLRIKTVGVQPGYLRVETSETRPRNIENLTEDQFYIAQMHPTNAMVTGSVFRPVSTNPLHSEVSPSSTVSSVTIPVELDNYIPKDRLYHVMKSPQQMFVMGAIDEDVDAEMAEL